MNENQFKDKVVFVTGGTRGIGFATVKKFLAAGSKVCFLGSKQETVDNAVAKLAEIDPNYPIMYGHPLLWSPAEVGALMTQVVEKWGGIDILINNAGVQMDLPITRIPDGEFEYVMDVNVRGMYNVIKCAIPFMKAGMKAGRAPSAIVNTASVTGVYGSAIGVGYPASKAGVIGLTKALGQELSRFGIRVNCVAPGVINTDMVNNLSDMAKESFANTIPLKRLGEPDDIANAYMFLASQEAAYITATCLQVDGGYCPI